MCGLLAPCYVTRAKIVMTQFPKDVTRIKIWGDIVSHAMQVGMMRTRRCCWEVTFPSILSDV